MEEGEFSEIQHVAFQLTYHRARLARLTDYLKLACFNSRQNGFQEGRDNRNDPFYQAAEYLVWKPTQDPGPRGL